MPVNKQLKEPVQKDKTRVPGRLYRSETNRVIGGVAGGIGEYAGVDPTIIRLIFALLGIFGGSGLLLYLVLWVVLPTQSSVNNTSDPIRENMDEIKGRTKNLVASMKIENGNTNRHLGSIILIFLGLILILKNFGFYNIDLGKLWPVFLILFGVLLLRRR